MALPLIENKLKLLPDSPGCYLMKDRNGHIIYIGKAKNLKNRVRSYFKSSHTGKTAQLVSEIRDFEIIETQTNKESLLLEINLIQRYKPHYNIMLKYGTMYPYIKITNEKDPTLEITSEVKDDGGKYFGPYPNVNAATSTLDLLWKVYPLRHCPRNQKKACFYYHIEQCIGCCDHEITKEEYKKQIHRIERFLKGSIGPIKAELKKRMMRASENMEFERAAQYRDQINYLTQTVEPQNIMNKAYNNRDVFAFYLNQGWISIQIFMLRQFTIIKRDSALFPIYDDRPEEALMSYIGQFYQDQNHTLPKEIIVPDGMDNETLSEALGISVKTPQRGSKRHMLDLAEKNARYAHMQRFKLLEMNEKKTRGAVQELSEALNLPYLHVIESIDHSHNQGVDVVSGLVVYEDGKPNKKKYRKYKIKSFEGANEFAATKEVVKRRYSRLLRENSPLPNALFMDGGEIEVHAAREALEEIHLTSLPVIGMVKDDKHRTSFLISGEELKEVPLDPNSQAFHLVQRIQIEVDRWAKSYHHQLHQKNSFSSRLEEIPGVGKKTRLKVMKHFKTLKAIQESSIEEIHSLGIPTKVATSIFEELQEEKKKDSLS